MRVLVVDVGGTHIKLAIAGTRRILKIDSGPDLTATRMVRDVLQATEGWTYDVVTIGYPGPVRHERPLEEPHNLGGGWRRCDFAKKFGKPVRIVNDAAMQALGSYQGGRMLFMGLGTGLGSAVIDHGRLEPLELAHLPYKDGLEYEDFLGTRGLKRLGRKQWRRQVGLVAELLRRALICDYVVLGGGNVKQMSKMPPHCRRGDNANAFRGGGRVWSEHDTLHARPVR